MRWFYGVNDKSLSNQKINKLLFKFAVPAILSLLVNEIYNMVGTVFAGRYIGTNAIGALTVEFPIQRFLIAVGLFIAIGTSTYVSRVMGEKDIGKLKKIIINSFILTFISFILILFLVIIFKNPILHMLGASNETYPLANRYLSIALIGTVFQALSAVCCYIMISFGKTNMTVYTNIIGVSLNISISYILIVKMGMGIEGSAIAVVIAQFAAVMFALLKFIKISKKLNIKFTDKSISNVFDMDILNEIIVGGFSTFVVEISDAVVSSVLNNLLRASGGDSAIIIVGIITKISMFLYITIIGISSAMEPIAAYNFGAGNYKRVKETFKISVKSVIIASAVLWAVFMNSAYSIIGFFLRDNALLHETVRDFRICISMIPLIGIYYVIIYYYQAIGESKKSFLLSIYREMIILIPLAVFLTRIFGTKGVIIAYPITDSIVVLTSIYFMKKILKGEVQEEIQEETNKHAANRRAFGNVPISQSQS